MNKIAFVVSYHLSPAEGLAGGFVPIGEYEKKDDVPARLSKNEFVFTADAVRAAGGGNINKGAKRMYETMKNLEAQPTAKRMTA